MTEILPDRIYDEVNQTRRPISEGAEKWLNRPISCLDYGFVYLVDYTGTDGAIAQAARTSYGAGTRKVSEDNALIRYLRRHVHTSPTEMVEVKFHCKMPIFVARQWVRHRTASLNEYSGRYSEMIDEFYMPDDSVLKKQSKDNKQGRDEDLTLEEKAEVHSILKDIYQREFRAYQRLLELGLARELARIPLGVANYTQWYWKIDLHNLMHFLRLRLDPHAQYEIRVYANAMARIIEDAFPVSFKAFEDYQLHALSFSRLELEILEKYGWPMDKVKANEVVSTIPNKREREEFLAKLDRIHFLT